MCRKGDEMHYLLTYEEYGKETKYICICDILLTAWVLTCKELGISTLTEMEFNLVSVENEPKIYEYNIGGASYMVYELPYAVQ